MALVRRCRKVYISWYSCPAGKGGANNALFLEHADARNLVLGGIDMKKRIWLLGIVLTFVLGIFVDTGRCQYDYEYEDEDTEEMETEGERTQEAIENIRDKGNREGWDVYQRWNAYLRGTVPNPRATDEEAAQDQAINDHVGERAETAAEFTDAASTVVSAAAPSPSVVSTAGTTAVGAAVGAAAAPKPSLWKRFCNWVGSFF